MPQTGPTAVNTGDNVIHRNATSLQYNCIKNYKTKERPYCTKGKIELQQMNMYIWKFYREDLLLYFLD